MKKRLWIVLIILLAAILFVPVPSGIYKDGGTREYRALTYKLVRWNRLTAEDFYTETKIYWFPDNFKSIDTLWAEELPNITHKLVATILEKDDSTVIVQPVENQQALASADKISVGINALEDIDAQVGDLVEITYVGGIMESYPAQINATYWEIARNLRHMEYTEQWLDKTTAEKQENNIFDHIRITKIYSNCFFATPVIPLPREIKFNGKLSEEWCVGDQISCTYENTYYDSETNRIEADMLTIEASDWQPEPNVCYKPVIYLYPEKQTDVSVELLLEGSLTCTYPAYNNGWKVTAHPDGTLTDAKGQTYNYLYWEGQTSAQWDLTKGFCIKGTDTAVFLEEALEKLGLTRREANEFIVYWLPLMEQNPYNIITFQQETYTDAAKLHIDPAPDALIRVFMTWQSADSFVEIPPQELIAPKRIGFTAVEWGGTEIK